MLLHLLRKSGGEETWEDGPAIFSKYNIFKSKIHILSKSNRRAAVEADIQIEDRILHVFSTHLLHTHQQQSNGQGEQVKNLIKILPTRQTIVMGDFNATPDSLVIQGMRKVLVDSDPASLPTWSLYPEGCLTCAPSDVKIRLDYIFTSRDIKISSHKVELSKGSDHLPISAIIEI